MESWKYPMPKPDENNANSSHGTKDNGTRRANDNGSMANRGGVNGGGMGRRRRC